MTTAGIAREMRRGAGGGPEMAGRPGLMRFETRDPT